MIEYEEILNLYFIKKYKQIEVSKLLNVSKSKVNRIIMSDERYLKEKIRRKNANKAKNKQETINYITNKRKSKKFDDVYESLKKQHIEASIQLSGGRKQISNRTYRDWNTSIYKFNKNSKSYVLKKGINVGYGVPKKIYWN